MSALPTIAINIEAVLSRHTGRSYAEIWRHLQGAGFASARVRDSLFSLCSHGRVRRTGKRCRYQYWLTDKATPRPEAELHALRSEVVESAATRTQDAGTALAPNWPVIEHALLRRNLTWRISA